MVAAAVEKRFPKKIIHPLSRHIVPLTCTEPRSHAPERDSMRLFWLRDIKFVR